MPRIPLPDRDALNEAQAAVWDRVVSGPRGRVIGPLRAVIHAPDLAARWSAFGEGLRYGTTIPKRQKELAIAITGRRYSAQVEWWVHAGGAREAGVPDSALDAIRDNTPPAFADADDAIVYAFARALHLHGGVTDAQHAAVVARWGVVGVVELTAVIGYYTMVSMMLNAQEIPLPEGIAPPLTAPPTGLAPLPEEHA